MMTQTIQSESALSAVSRGTSPVLDMVTVQGSDGSVRTVQRDAKITAHNSEPCTIYFVDAQMRIEPLSDSFSDFDKLVDTLEQSAESTVQLNDARKWIASKFYGELPTLSSLRLSAGLSQKQLAYSCEIEQPHVSRYESGRHAPSLEIAALMSSVFGVTMDEFFLAWRNTQAQIK